MADITDIEHGGPSQTRRDFVVLAASAIAGVGAVVTAWPFIDSLYPAAVTFAAGAPFVVDLSAV